MINKSRKAWKTPEVTPFSGASDAIRHYLEIGKQGHATAVERLQRGSNNANNEANSDVSEVPEE